MKKILILLVLFIVSSCVFAQEAELEYKFKENAHHKFKEKSVIKHEANVLNQSISSITEMLIDIDEITVSVGDKAKIKQVSAVEESSIDGKSNLDQIEDKTNTVYYEVDKLGKNYSVKDEDEKDFPDFDADKETPVFPGKKVKVGDTWERKMSVGDAKVKTVCKLEKLYSVKGVDIAKINLEFDDTVKVDSEDDAETIVKGTGIFYYAVNYGNDLYMNYDVNFEMNLPVDIEGVSGNANAKINYNYTYWRCE